MIPLTKCPISFTPRYHVILVSGLLHRVIFPDGDAVASANKGSNYFIIIANIPLLHGTRDPGPSNRQERLLNPAEAAGAAEHNAGYAGSPLRRGQPGLPSRTYCQCWAEWAPGPNWSRSATITGAGRWDET